MTRLREALDDYLAVRRTLGFKLKNASYLLPEIRKSSRSRGSDDDHD